MRGPDPDNYIHVTHKGDPKFVGLAFEAASEEDLDIISKADGAAVRMVAIVAMCSLLSLHGAALR